MPCFDVSKQKAKLAARVSNHRQAKKQEESVYRDLEINVLIPSADHPSHKRDNIDFHLVYTLPLLRDMPPEAQELKEFIRDSLSESDDVKLPEEAEEIELLLNRIKIIKGLISRF